METSFNCTLYSTGSLSCQSFEPTTRHLLCSFKPSQKHPSVRHQLCELNCVNISADPTALDMTCSCDIVQTFHAGRTQTLLSKSLLLPHPSMDNNMMVFAGDESTQSVSLLMKYQGLQCFGFNRLYNIGRTFVKDNLIPVVFT